MDEGLVGLVDRGIALGPARLRDVEGFTHIDKDKSCTLFTPPALSPLSVDTLSGFVKLLEVGFEAFDPTKTLVHVEDFNQVHLISISSDKWGRRQKFVVAQAPNPERKFSFNSFMGQEEFNIALRSMFVQDDSLDALVALAGNIAKISEVKQEDDGFSQSMSMKDGQHLVKTQTVKPRVTLKPFRTFLEVDQPEGDYIFRVKFDERAGNTCALFEADAGRWKITAMDTIAAWLRQQISTSPVTEINNLPVIA